MGRNHADYRPARDCNVAGATGIHYMLEAGGQMPLNYYVNLPSCVPATRFEHSGCVMDARNMIKLVNEPGVLGMGEMMNVPGVIYNSAEVQKKLDLFQSLGRVIDGHAPACVARSWPPTLPAALIPTTRASAG